MPYKSITSTIIPALAGPTGWVRTAKRVSISTHTPSWMVQILVDWSKR